MPRRGIQAITERTVGITRGQTQSARSYNYGETNRMGRGSYVAYNVQDDVVDTEGKRASNRERQVQVAESVVGRPLTDYEKKHLRITRLDNADARVRTRPVDNITGERLNIYRNMTAFKITLS